jgi:hypothetical protein
MRSVGDNGLCAPRFVKAEEQQLVEFQKGGDWRRLNGLPYSRVAQVVGHGALWQPHEHRPPHVTRIVDLDIGRLHDRRFARVGRCLLGSCGRVVIRLECVRLLCHLGFSLRQDWLQKICC